MVGGVPDPFKVNMHELMVNDEGLGPVLEHMAGKMGMRLIMG